MSKTFAISCPMECLSELIKLAESDNIDPSEFKKLYKMALDLRHADSNMPYLANLDCSKMQKRTDFIIIAMYLNVTTEELLYKLRKVNEVFVKL